MLLSEPPRSAGDLNFSLFGFPVRIHPMFWLVGVILNARLAEHDGALLLFWILAVTLSILVHELGHAVVIRHFGERPWITLYGMGGLASYSRRFDPQRQILISLAGPAAGFLFAAVIAAAMAAAGAPVRFHFGGMGLIHWTVPRDAFSSLRLLNFIHFLLEINIWWGVVNLLPIWPLDGGHIARSVLQLTRPAEALRISLWLSIAAAGAVAFYGAKQQEIYLALFFGLLAFQSFQQLQAFSGRGGGGYGEWR